MWTSGPPSEVERRLEQQAILRLLRAREADRRETELFTEFLPLATTWSTLASAATGRQLAREPRSATGESHALLQARATLCYRHAGGANDGHRSPRSDLMDNVRNYLSGTDRRFMGEHQGVSR